MQRSISVCRGINIATSSDEGSDSPEECIDDAFVLLLLSDVERKKTVAILQAQRVQTSGLVHEELGDLLQAETRREVEQRFACRNV